MDIVLFFPPQWYTGSPYLSVPLLAGQLLSKGYTFESHDLNIDFYNEVLKKDYLKTSLKLSSDFIKKYKKKYLNLKKNNYDNLSLDEKILVSKYEKISDFFNKNSTASIDKILNYIDSAINVTRTEDFYNPRMHYNSKIILEYALDIVSLPYSPSIINNIKYENTLLNWSYDDVIYFVNNPTINIFYDYYRKKLKNKYKDSNLFGISVASESQIVPALTLSKYLKERKKGVKVALGGGLITRITDTFKKYPELFMEYCDYVLPNDGEESIIQLVKAEKGEINYSEVSNLIYKDVNSNNIIENVSIPVNVDEITIPCFKGYDLKKYFAPDIVMLIQLSKGCYWAKCAFCSFSYKKSYSHRPIKDIIDEIKYYIENFNIRYFRFSDDALPPKFFSELADEIIKQKLDIKYVVYSRLEKEFTYDLLKKIHESGCVIIQWGFESANRRILEFMSKGTENTDFEKILKDADNAGIANYLFLMIGMPSETYEDALETFNFIKDGRDYIYGFIPSRFCLEKKSILIDNYQKYGIKNINDNEAFLAHLNMDSLLLNSEDLSNLRKMYQNFFSSGEEKRIRLSSIMIPDYNFLYIIKYGKDKAKNLFV